MKDKLKQLLAEQIGVDPEDLNDDDSFLEDLHMGPAEITDFSQKLGEEGFDIEQIDWGTVETLGDLVERLDLHETVL